jgi:hypothetical protein
VCGTASDAPNANFGFVSVTSNSATSDYNALQVKFQRRLSRGLQALASYTFSHSIDIASTDAVPDSKTPTGVAELPLTPMAVQALRDQMAIAGSGRYLFPSEESATGYQRSLRTVWRPTLRRAKIPYFRIYDLRSTYATRLSAGGVADEWVTQLLRQSDSKVFKKYSQMKLRMQREALEKMNRRANEMTVEVTTAVHEPKRLCTVPAQS